MKRFFLLLIFLFTGVFISAQSLNVNAIYTYSGFENRINNALQINYHDSSFINLANEISKELDLLVFDRLLKGKNIKVTDKFEPPVKNMNSCSPFRIGRTSEILNMHILDSLYFADKRSHIRYILYFDSDLNCTKVTNEIFDSTSFTWRPKAIMELYYNSRNQLVKNKTRLWNSSLGRWNNYDCSIYNFDDKGRIILYEFYEGTPVNKLSYKRLRYRFYYPDNQIIIQTKYSGFNEKWLPKDSTISQFNTEGRLVSEKLLIYDKDKTLYSNSMKAYFYYYSNNVLSEVIQMKWHSPSQLWKYDAKIDYIKTIHGFDSLDVYSKHYGFWKAEYHVKYKVSAYGKHTYIEKQYWDNASQSWRNEIKEYLNYDSKQRLSKYKAYFWDYQSHKWELYDAYKINYIISQSDSITVFYGYSSGVFKPSFMGKITTDPQIPINRVIPSYVFSNMPIDHKLLYEGVYYLNMDTTIGNLAHEIKYYYSTKDTGSADVIANEYIPFKVFPNPSNSNIIFQFNVSAQNAEVFIYDMNGRLVLEKTVSNDESIYVNNISAGTYMYKVKLGNGEYHGKLVFY